jgi:AraC family transcriptional activator of pobA
MAEVRNVASLRELSNPRYARRYRRQNAHLAEAVNALPPFQSSGLPLRVVLCHRTRPPAGSGPDRVGAYHTHPYIELTFVDEGTTVYRTQDEEIAVTAGEVMVMPPHTAHRWDVRSGPSALLGFMIAIQPSRSPDRLGAFENSTRELHAHLSPLPEIKRMERMLLETVAARTCRPDMAASIMRAAVDMVFRQILGRFRTDDESGAAAPGARRRYERARTYIDANLAQHPTVAEVADFVGVSRRQLYRLFRSQASRSPKAHIDQCRVDHARELLAGGFSVKAAALELGFSDPAYFSRFYKQHTGRSPGKERPAA